jgi:hypothetical protein
MHPLHSSSRDGVLDVSYKRPLLRVERRGCLMLDTDSGAYWVEASGAEAPRSIPFSVIEWHCKGARDQCSGSSGGGHRM